MLAETQGTNMDPKRKNLAKGTTGRNPERFMPLRQREYSRKRMDFGHPGRDCMTANNFARPPRFNKQRVSRLEQDEKLGKVTVRTLRHVAAALGLRIRLWICPEGQSGANSEKPGEDRRPEPNVPQRSRPCDWKQQELSHSQKEKAFESLIQDSSAHMPKYLWDEP